VSSTPTAVRAVVVTYNSGAFIGECLESLAHAFVRGEDLDVVVADNGSDDDTLEIVRRVMPEARILELGDNLGYAPAINRAARDAEGSAVFVLNPDLVLERGSGSALLAALTANPEIGIAVPVIREPDGRVFAALRRRPTILRALGEALLGGSRAGACPALGETVPPGPAYAQPTVADWATGACWLVRAECATTVGAWDERFWLYSEETDYALRAGDAGWTVQLVPDAEVVHVGGESNTNPRLWTVLTTNRIRSYAKRHGPVATAWFWGAVVLNEMLRAPRHHTNRAALRALLRGPVAIATSYETARGPRPVSRSKTDT